MNIREIVVILKHMNKTVDSDLDSDLFELTELTLSEFDLVNKLDWWMVRYWNGQVDIWFGRFGTKLVWLGQAHNKLTESSIMGDVFSIFFKLQLKPKRKGA